MCTDHQHGQRRCRCCDPEARRAARRTTQLRERGWDGDVDEVYAAGTVQERAAFARTSPAATFDRSPTVRSARARRGFLTPDEQATLAADESPRVRAALAANPGAEQDTLDALSADADKRVREAVARHERTPPDSLYALATTLDRRRDLSVARALAQNSTTPMVALEAIVANGTTGQVSLAQRALQRRGQNVA